MDGLNRRMEMTEKSQYIQSHINRYYNLNNMEKRENIV